MKKRLDLMTSRICDLKLDLEKSPLMSRIEKLYTELQARHLHFRPPCYFADEWFVPEGDPVIGIPFYLATPQLRRHEKQLMGDIEGGNKSYFMKLLRHEAGHAVSYAFRLHQLKIYRQIFGLSNKRFSDHYPFDPNSKNYVINLDHHYAQSHPDEDFAETFAVWLTFPHDVWTKKYRGWPALQKLNVMNRLMKNIQQKSPLILDGEKMCHVSTLTYTLKTYYKRRQALQAHHQSTHDK